MRSGSTARTRPVSRGRGQDRVQGLIDASGWLSEAGREIKERIESLTDDLAAPAYDSLESTELDQLIADLEPISAALEAAGYR